MQLNSNNQISLKHDEIDLAGNKKKNILKPFLKFPGGKTGLLNILLPMIPEHKRYVEPFVGGGALFFALQPTKAIIADANDHLINTYVQIKDNVFDVIGYLQTYKEAHCEEFYYKLRKRDRLNKFNIFGARNAARWIYLNKTCFNGLVRVNKQNQFNVPIGKYTNPKIIDVELLFNISKYLNTNDIEIKYTSFEITLADVQEGDFIYFDPPYFPISDTSSFVTYTADGFNLNDHINLKAKIDKLNDKGIKWILSNSYCKPMLDLWKDYNIIEISEKRTISASLKGRKVVKEILVKNF